MRPLRRMFAAADRMRGGTFDSACSLIQFDLDVNVIIFVEFYILLVDTVN